MLDLFLNKPPQWLARALQIVSGGAAPAIDPVLKQVVEAGQGGWGLGATFAAVTLTFPVGVAATQTIVAANDALTRIVWVSAENNDSVANRIAFNLNAAGGSGTAYVVLFFGASGTSVPINTIRGHAEWFGNLTPVIVPPGCSLEVSMSAVATVANRVRCMVGTMPAGVKPW